MKIIEGLKPYEVMRLHKEEGKRVAIRKNREGLGGFNETSTPKWNWGMYEYAIIDLAETIKDA